MSIDLQAAAIEYLQARRARGYRSTDHAWLISSFLDGLAGACQEVCVRDLVGFPVDLVVRSRLPSGAGRWRWMRLGGCVSPVEVVSAWFGRDRRLD